MRRVIPAAVLVLLLASCRGERAEAPETASQPAATTTATTTAGTAALAPAASASQLASVTEQNGAVTIAFTENGQPLELFGEKRGSGKRKYTLGDGPVLYEVKPADDGDGFKLRSPDGKLRWKVKVTPEKIKVSDNEQNDHPFELKVKDVNRVKVVAPGDRVLGNVRFAPNQIEVENAGGRVIFTTDSTKPAGAYGVLLCDGIPERERYILVAELLSRGR